MSADYDSETVRDALLLTDAEVVALAVENQQLRDALETMVDVTAYLHANPNSPHADKWNKWREDALDKAAAALTAVRVEERP
jgi:hypothetical protein